MKWLYQEVYLYRKRYKMQLIQMLVVHVFNGSTKIATSHTTPSFDFDC